MFPLGKTSEQIELMLGEMHCDVAGCFTMGPLLRTLGRQTIASWNVHSRRLAKL